MVTAGSKIQSYCDLIFANFDSLIKYAWTFIQKWRQGTNTTTTTSTGSAELKPNETMKNSKIHRYSICVTDGSHDSTIKIPWLLLILTVSHFHSLFFLLWNKLAKAHIAPVFTPGSRSSPNNHFLAIFPFKILLHDKFSLFSRQKGCW